jgi:hypothetical protein
MEAYVMYVYMHAFRKHIQIFYFRYIFNMKNSVVNKSENDRNNAQTITTKQANLKNIYRHEKKWQN